MKTNRDRRHEPAMTVSIAGLEEKEYPFRFEVPAESLELQEFFSGSVVVTGSVAKVGSQLRIRGVAESNLTGECDRCLASVARPMQRDFSLFVQISDEVEKDDSGPQRDEGDRMLTIGSEENQVVLDPEVRQTLRLSVPMKLLCREECKGLCPRCGANLNEGECGCERQAVDPRWAKLEQLLPGRDQRN